MRVAIDARLNAYRRGGIPEYTRQLVAALAPLSRGDTFITLQHREHQKPLVVAPNVQRRTLFTPPHHRFEQIALPAELLALRPDLLHCTDFVVPLRRPCPAVVTIHDLAFLHFPEILDDAARRYYGQVRASVASAQAVIAVSEATRADIVSLLGLPAERIDVVYEAAGPEFRPPGPDDDTERVFAGQTLQSGSFMLFVSTLEPRKNLPMLLAALKICRDRRPDAHYRLAVAGARGWRYQAIFDAVREHELEEVVLFLGSMNGEQLRWLYGHCRLYANPSLYEGFGLPVLEAMACGAPTLASNTSSLPELVGNVATLLPPSNPEAWADAIEALWHDQTRRAALSAAGPAQAARFTWRSAAQQTLAIYQRVAAKVSVATPDVAPFPALEPQLVVGNNGVAPDLLPEQHDVVPINAQPADQPVLDSAGTTTVAMPVSDEVVLPQVLNACVRCGAALHEGTLEGARWRAADDGAIYTVQAWACTNCGALDMRLGDAVAQPEAPPAQTVEELAATMASEATAEETPAPTPAPAKPRVGRAAVQNKPTANPAPKTPAKSRRSGRKG